jgi:hypothetical protein
MISCAAVDVCMQPAWDGPSTLVLAAHVLQWPLQRRPARLAAVGLKVHTCIAASTCGMPVPYPQHSFITPALLKDIALPDVDHIVP